MAGVEFSAVIVSAIKAVAVNIFVQGIQAVLNEESEVDPFKAVNVKGLSAQAEVDRPTSFYGYTIPLIYGISRIDTNLIWVSPYDRRTITQTILVSADKGIYRAGGDQYQTVKVTRDFVDFAVLICAGPIGGIRRVWFNHALVLDNDRWGDSKPFYNGQQLNYEIYLGAEDQGASPTILSHEANAPAYRGRAYLVFRDIDITLLGGFIPVVQVEVIGVNNSGYQVINYDDYLPSAVQQDTRETLDTPGDDIVTLKTKIVDYIRADGNIVPLPFASIDIPQQAFTIMRDIMTRTGLASQYWDITQLGKKITGLAITDKGPVRPFVEGVLNYANGVIQESDGKLKFAVNPRLPEIPSYRQNCLISEIGLTVNSLHDVDGRDGYFSSSGGTSEGQFVTIWACCKAYQATGQQYWLDRSLFLAGALERYLYGRNVPSVPEIFIPHWLFNVKRPIQEESSILNYEAAAVDHGSYLEAFIPFPAKRIDRAYRKSSALIWENREAELVNFSYLGRKRLVSLRYEKRKKVLDYFGSHHIKNFEENLTFESYSKTAQKTGTQLNIINAYQSGGGWIVQTSKPADFDYYDSHIIVAFTLKDHGEIINVGDKYEAWPHWRKLEIGEIDAAGDSLYWAHDAYELLYQITSDTKWYNALQANKYTIIESHDIDDARQVFKPEIANTPFTQPGTFSRSERDGFGHYNWKRRRSDGVIYASIPKGLGEVQIGRGVNDFWRSPSDTFLARIKREYKEGYDPHEVYEWVGPTLTFTSMEDEIYIWIDTNIVFSESTRYFAKLPAYVDGNITDYTLNLTDFVTKLDALNPTRELTSGADIKAVGLSIFNSNVMRKTRQNFDNSFKLEIHLLRPLPIIELPYTPYAPMYTVNMLNNNLVDWRGVPGMGYCYPHAWHEIGIDDGMATQLDFLTTAQDEYQAHFGSATKGPFIPAYYWDRQDARQYGAVDTWGWSWVDPNSQWGGYQYRCLVSVSKAALETSNADAIAIVQNWLAWLNTNWTTSAQFPPTDFPEILPVWAASTQFNSGFYNAVIDIARATSANGYVYKPLNTGITGAIEPAWPTTLYATVVDGGITWECSGYQYQNAYGNYTEPHMAAMIMRAAIYANLAGISTLTANALIARCYNYLDTSYQTTGEMSGSWSVNGDWWMFWHSEIIGTLAILLDDGAAIITALSLDAGKINTWLSGSNEFINRNTRT